jgi:hypothetical protein
MHSLRKNQLRTRGKHSTDRKGQNNSPQMLWKNVQLQKYISLTFFGSCSIAADLIRRNPHTPAKEEFFYFLSSRSNS